MNMKGSEQITICCFCVDTLKETDAVFLIVSSKKMEPEQQRLFAHPVCLKRVLNSLIPLHPDLE